MVGGIISEEKSREWHRGSLGLSPGLDLATEPLRSRLIGH